LLPIGRAKLYGVGNAHDSHILFRKARPANLQLCVVIS